MRIICQSTHRVDHDDDEKPRDAPALMTGYAVRDLGVPPEASNAYLVRWENGAVGHYSEPELVLVAGNAKPITTTLKIDHLPVEVVRTLLLVARSMMFRDAHHVGTATVERARKILDGIGIPWNEPWERLRQVVESNLS